uniref:Geminin coiled-coil domain containing n=1 Tax=Amphiprion ocellaris TaxID=80972 RepID=A0AAQ5YMR4_AMPOC
MSVNKEKHLKNNITDCLCVFLSESQCGFYGSPPAGLMWTEQISPHLQRNKQLQDTLLQREEELARLQEENNKLREFLNSSFVRNLEQKAKKLESPCETHSSQLSKRVCRNLTAEFCSESSTPSEPNLDLWVLRTLGLKDRDTIDTPNESLSDCSPRGLVYDAAVTPSSSPEDNLIHFPQMSTSNQPWTPGSPTHPSALHWSPAAPPMPCGRSDLAFSMSLSPSSSVKTHSFPQGQAFVRKDTGGRWNFTWVPKQGP